MAFPNLANGNYGNDIYRKYSLQEVYKALKDKIYILCEAHIACGSFMTHRVAW